MKPPAVLSVAGIPNYQCYVIWHWCPCLRSANSLFLKGCRIKVVGSYLCSKRNSVHGLGNVCENNRILPLSASNLLLCCGVINTQAGKSVFEGKSKDEVLELSLLENLFYFGKVSVYSWLIHILRILIPCKIKGI